MIQGFRFVCFAIAMSLATTTLTACGKSRTKTVVSKKSDDPKDEDKIQKALAKKEFSLLLSGIDSISSFSLESIPLTLHHLFKLEDLTKFTFYKPVSTHGMDLSFEKSEKDGPYAYNSTGYISFPVNPDNGTISIRQTSKISKFGKVTSHFESIQSIKILGAQEDDLERTIKIQTEFEIFNLLGTKQSVASFSHRQPITVQFNENETRIDWIGISQFETFWKDGNSTAAFSTDSYSEWKMDPKCFGLTTKGLKGGLILKSKSLKTYENESEWNFEFDRVIATSTEYNYSRSRKFSCEK
ncbi:MAG: hypothetical protein KDD25_01065 [Bdellovibrionales bacterium]|nr:hypothetical protein [Bdellovibrionales bacterium]